MRNPVMYLIPGEMHIILAVMYWRATGRPPSTSK